MSCIDAWAGMSGVSAEAAVKREGHSLLDGVLCELRHEYVCPVAATALSVCRFYS